MAEQQTYQMVVAIRGQLIEHIADALSSAVLAPDIASAEANRLIRGYEPLISAYEESVRGCHSSSASSYALRDVPADQGIAHTRARHALRLLSMLHGPQASDGSDG